MGVITKTEHDIDDKDYYISLLSDLCKGYDIDFQIMAAICDHESLWNPYKVRYEPKDKNVTEVDRYAKLNQISFDTEKIMQICSWGLGQVMGGTARTLGYKGPLSKLIEPELGLDLACKYFAKNCNRFPSIDKKIAAYNRGSIVFIEGKLANQSYVDKVMALMPKYKD